MRCRSARRPRRLQRAAHLQDGDVLGRHATAVRLLVVELEEEAHGEADVKGDGVFDLVHLVVRQRQRQRVDVLLEVLELAAADDGIDVGILGADVGDGDAGDGGVLFLGQGVERGGDGAALVGGLVRLAAFVFGGCELLVRLEEGAPHDAPGRDGHAFALAHGEDVAFEVAHHGGPETLVDGELRQAVLTGVLIRFGHDPGRRVADAEVQNLARGDDAVQGLHQLGDGGGKVPPVDVEEVDVVGLELLEGGFQR